MDGATLTRELQQLLSETSSGTWLDTKSNYDYLYEAALTTADRINAFSTSATITTVADDLDYYLPADFLKLYLTDKTNRSFIKYNNGSDDYFIYFKPYEEIILADNDDSVAIPSEFSIIDAPALTQITGTTTSAGAVANGECTLTDTAGGFSTATVNVGDFVQNTSDGSHGIILAITSTTALVTALFGGTNNDWTSGDAYIINPQGRFQLILDPPPSTSGHTITVYHIQRPAPVYSPKRSYRFAPHYKRPLINYAAWLYKYRDSEPNFGDAFYKYWDNSVRRFGTTLNQAMKRTQLKVNMIR